MTASKNEIDLIVEELISLDRKKQFMDEWRALCGQVQDEQKMEVREDMFEVRPEDWEDARPVPPENEFDGKIVATIVASAFAILAALCLVFVL